MADPTGTPTIETGLQTTAISGPAETKTALDIPAVDAAPEDTNTKTVHLTQHYRYEGKDYKPEEPITLPTREADNLIRASWAIDPA